MATFTLTGTFAHQDAATTPIVNTKISIAADPYPLSTKLLALGKVVETDANGQISVAMTTGVTGLYYVVRSLAKHPVFQPIRFLAPASGTIDITSLVFYNPSGVPPLQADLVAIRDAALAAVASVKIGTWQATTAYVTDQTVQAPDGSLIKSLSSRTSRATFDATEQTNWTPVATKVGTLEQVANKATYTQVIEAPLSPYRYGFVGDGSADDSTALQNAINAVPAGGVMELPHTGNAKITTALAIAKAITIRGRSKFGQRILAFGCNGINIAAGTADVNIRDLEIAHNIRYSTTANTLVGINVDGTAASHSSGIDLERVYCDGFNTGFQIRYTWASSFRGCATNFGLRGLASYGLSSNNVVYGNCQFVITSGGANSRSIALTGQESSSNATAVASEGWMISDSLLYGAEIGLDIVGTNHVYVENSIIDFSTLNGVRVIHSGTSFANNVKISGSYIAMSGASGSAAISLQNTVSNTQRRYARLVDNELLVYSGSTCPFGIDVAGSQTQAIVRGNTTTGFSTADVRMLSSDSIVHGNAFLSAVTPNVLTSLPNDVADNIGSVQRTGAFATTTYSRDTLGRKTLRATSVPTTGTWAVGDRVINDVPTVGQPKAWSCTAAGTPGTWVSEGNL